MAERYEELMEIVRDASKPMKERIEAAKELYRLYKKGEPVPAIVTMIARTDIDELRETIEEEAYAKGTEEEALIKGIFEAKKEAIRKRLEKMPLTEVAKSFLRPESKVEREIARELLKGKEKVLKEEAEVLSAAAEAMKAEAMSKYAEFIEESIPGITSPAEFGFLSRRQIKNVNKPSRWYAKQAFMNGFWNSKWGDPEQYGIDVKTAVSYVGKPKNKDFALVAYSRGVWRVEWGDPEDYGIFE